MKKNELITLGLVGAGAWFLLRPRKAEAAAPATGTPTEAGTKYWGDTLVPRRVTYFGGPSDSIESLHGVAGLPQKRAGETPAQYYRRVPDWVREHLRGEMASMDEWPVVTGKHWKTGETKTGPAGVSYFLDHDGSAYAAWRYRPDQASAVRVGNARLLGYNEKTGNWDVIARIIDWGPAFTDTLDVSRRVQKKIKELGYKKFKATF